MPFSYTATFNPLMPPIRVGALGTVLVSNGPTVATPPTFQVPGALGLALGVFALAPPLLAGENDNFNPVPVGPPVWPATYGRIDLNANAGNANITGMAAGFDGQVVMLRNSQANTIVLNSYNAGSLAANQFLYYFDPVIPPQKSLMVVYYGASTGVNSGNGGWVVFQG